MLEPGSKVSAEVDSAPLIEKSPTLDWRLYLAVFAIAIVVTTLHHQFEVGTKVALLFDGRHYFESCQKACELMLALIAMHADKVVDAERAFRPYVMLDGPILPMIFGSFYACFGHVPVSEEWTELVWLQTVLQGVAAVLICKLTFQLTRRKLVAFICSGLWILYPAALIASGRLMTENIAVVLLLSLPLLLRGAMRASGKDTQSSLVAPSGSGSLLAPSLLVKTSQLFAINQFGFASGIISGLLILLKPGMIPSVVLTWLACLAFSKQRFAVCISLLLGTGLALCPWLLYTKQTTGKAAITVQRMPVHNALVGWDPETRGWQTNPPSGFERVLNTGGEPISTIEGIWFSHPQQCFEILFDKIGHLYSTPWNDYRAKALFLSTEAQELAHRVLLFAGLFGFAVWLTSDLRRSRLALLCATAAGGQCVYLMFEPVCRYAFPQFAFAPVFFSLALLQLMSRPRKLKALAVSAFAALLATTLVLISEHNSNRYLQDASVKLAANDSLTTTISLKPEALRNAATAYVLVDADQNIEHAKVSIGGKRIDGQFLPLNYFDSQRYFALDLLKEIAYGLNHPITDFKIWRAMQIPLNLLKSDNAVIQIEATNACTIYGDTRGSTRNYLTPDFICVNRLINSKTSLETRNESPIPSAVTNKSFQLKSATSNNTLTDTPRVMLLLAIPQSSKQPPSASATLSSRILAPTASAGFMFTQKLSQKDFDENLRTADGEIKIGKSIIKAARTTASTVNIPHYDNATNLQITLQGELRATGKPGKIGIVVETVTAKKREYFLGRLPSYLPTTKEWSQFTITDIAPYVQNKEPVTSISVALFPGPWQQVAGYGCDRSCTDTTLRNLSLQVKPLDMPTLKHKQLLYF